MAQSTLQQAREDGYLDLHKWADNVVEHLKRNFISQKIYPFGFPGPYKGYINTPGAARSTGAGYRQIYSKVYAAAGGDTTLVNFFFNEYLQYVDMGVGAGQDLMQLKARGKYKNAKDPRKLHASWRERGDRQARPFLMKELRHQLRYLQALLWAYYADQTKIVMLSVVDDDGDAKFKTKL